MEFKSLLDKVSKDDTAPNVDRVVYRVIDNVDDFNEYISGVERIAISFKVHEDGLAMTSLSSQEKGTVFYPFIDLMTA